MGGPVEYRLERSPFSTPPYGRKTTGYLFGYNTDTHHNSDPCLYKWLCAVGGVTATHHHLHIVALQILKKQAMIINQSTMPLKAKTIWH